LQIVPLTQCNGIPVQSSLARLSQYFVLDTAEHDFPDYTEVTRKFAEGEECYLTGVNIKSVVNPKANTFCRKVLTTACSKHIGPTILLSGIEFYIDYPEREFFSVAVTTSWLYSMQKAYDSLIVLEGTNV